jgi:hypothetical protein
VTATSIRSLEKISAPVRTTRLGSEVRLPSGTWIDCRGDCRETLREQTIDFWDRLESRDNQNR